MTIAWRTKELVEQYNRLSNGHYFDHDTMRFFKSRLTEQYKRISDTEALFITTERFSMDTAQYATIRRAKLVEYTRESDGRKCQRISIDTVGEFNKLTLSQAKSKLKQLSKSLTLTNT